MNNLILFLKNKEKISYFSFLVLTLYFISYQLLVSLGWISDFVGGWYAKFSILILLVIIFNISDFLKDLIRTKIGVLYILFYLYIFIYLFLCLLSNPSLLPPFIHAATSLIHGFVLFFVGYYLNFNSPALLRNLYLGLIFSFIALIIYYIFTGNLMFNAQNLLEDEDAGVASYQVFGRSAFICLSVLILREGSFYKSIIISFLGIIVLFFLGARTEALGYIFICVLFLIYRSSFNPFRQISILSFFVLSIYYIYSQIDKILSTRFGQLLDFNNSSSWHARKEYLIYAQNTVSDNIILGDFGASYRYFGEVGANAHNIIAAWSNFGILGYLLFLLCCIVPIFLSIFAIINNVKNNRLIFSLFFGIACIILLFTSKSIFWIIPPFFWGVFLGALRKGFFIK